MAVGVQQQEEAASVGPTLKGKTKTLNTVAASEAKLDESKPCYYTWQQVAQHNRQESCWVIESGKVFDVTEFVSRHPGGNDFFMLAAGRDVTDLLPMVRASD